MCIRDSRLGGSIKGPSHRELHVLPSLSNNAQTEEDVDNFSLGTTEAPTVLRRAAGSPEDRGRLSRTKAK
eukprot:12893569-Alexandrium_andersonii.AAC.1